MAETNKSQKVYRVHTAIAETESENELLNWSKYTVIATDVETAIEIAKGKFNNPDEYVESVELVTELDA